MTRHIHADLIIQAANDTAIEWDWTYPAGGSPDWLEIVGTPFWEPSLIYRQRPAPHPHQAMMDKAKADPSIEWQILSSDGITWITLHRASYYWHESEQYRQKPKMVDFWQWAYQYRESRICATNHFYATKEDAQKAYGKIIICRIEGSKISVEVSQ